MDRYHPHPKFNRSFDSFRRFMRNKYPFGQPNCGYCVEFLTATQRINDLSCGAHQWVSVPVTGIYLSNENRSRLYLIVCYSSPDPTGLPNYLCFCVPLFVDRSDLRSGPKLLACFAPESVVPLSKGLYFEGDELKYDPLEDWCRFWKPLKRCLWPPERGPYSDCHGKRNGRDPEQERLTLEGISYKESVYAVARFWSESREELQNEIER
jgi:hypothetical protein